MVILTQGVLLSSQMKIRQTRIGELITFEPHLTSWSVVDLLWMGVLRLVVAIARETGDVCGGVRRVVQRCTFQQLKSCSGSWFFQPLWLYRFGAEIHHWTMKKPTLTTDWGRARGRNSRQKRSRPARRDQLRLLSIKQEQVKELDVSQTTRTSCRCCFMRSTANERPIPSRGLSKAYQLVNICTQAYILGTAHRLFVPNSI